MKRKVLIVLFFTLFIISGCTQSEKKSLIVEKKAFNISDYIFYYDEYTICGRDCTYYIDIFSDMNGTVVSYSESWAQKATEIEVIEIYSDDEIIAYDIKYHGTSEHRIGSDLSIREDINYIAHFIVFDIESNEFNYFMKNNLPTHLNFLEQFRVNSYPLIFTTDDNGDYIYIYD